MSAPVLFLDFDAVLHGVNDLRSEYTSYGIEFSGNRMLCHMPLLSRLLDRFPADLVITSSWRRQYGLDDLRGFFGIHAYRVIGTLSDFDIAHERPANRYQECRATAQWLGVKDWIVIDDQPVIVWGCWQPTPAQMRQVIMCDANLGLATPGVLDAIECFLVAAYAIRSARGPVSS